MMDEALRNLLESWESLAKSYMVASKSAATLQEAAELSRIAAAYEHCIESLREVSGTHNLDILES